MLVTFKTESSADVTLFGNIALSLLTMMGRDSKVPGALYADDVPAALSSLNKAINAQADVKLQANSLSQMSKPLLTEEEQAEPVVSIRHRALPLIRLLTDAVQSKSRVRWE